MSISRGLTNVLLVVVSLVAACVLGEIGVRIYAQFGGALGKRIAAWDPEATKVEPFGSFGYRQRPGAVFSYTDGTRATTNAQGWRGPTVAVPKPAGTLRVVILGGSTTYGYGVNDDETIDHYMRQDLSARFPGRKVEVVNLALDGYDAYQAWQRWLHDGVRLDPDVVVLNTGINDVRNARYQNLKDPDPRTLIWEDDMRRLREEQARGGPTLWTVLKHYSYLMRLPGVLHQALAARAASPSQGEQVYYDAADNFQKNVERLVSSAQQLGIPVILSTPPSMLMRAGAPAHMVPRSYWVVSPQVTQAYRDTLAARLTYVAHEDSTGARPVTHLVPSVPPGDFLDDCHLTPDGNRAIAAVFSNALQRLLHGSDTLTGSSSIKRHVAGERGR
jgi:lysophospholipase L1-like esterase